MGKANSPSFQYLAEKFPSVSAAKMKEAMFMCPQIKSASQDEGFKQTLLTAELEAWFRWLYENVHKSPARKRSSASAWFLPETGLSHVNENTLPALAPPGLSRNSRDEQGKRFHQDIQSPARRHQGSWNESMTADSCRMLWCDNPYIRASYAKRFLKKQWKLTDTDRYWNSCSIGLTQTQIQNVDLTWKKKQNKSRSEIGIKNNWFGKACRGFWWLQKSVLLLNVSKGYRRQRRLPGSHRLEPCHDSAFLKWKGWILRQWEIEC